MEHVALVKYDRMCAAIIDAHEVDEVKDIRDKAMALAAYARQSKNIEMEIQLAEIRLRAERKAGQLLGEVEKAKGGRPTENRSAGTTSFPSAKTLSDYGLTKDQSSKFQRLAAVPEEIFEREVVRRDEVPTTDGIISAASSEPRSPVSDDALWLWGRLRDFERRGVFERSSRNFLATMTETMIDDTIKLAPLVARWLITLGDLDEE